MSRKHPKSQQPICTSLGFFFPTSGYALLGRWDSNPRPIDYFTHLVTKTKENLLCWSLDYLFTISFDLGRWSIVSTRLWHKRYTNLARHHRAYTRHTIFRISHLFTLYVSIRGCYSQQSTALTTTLLPNRLYSFVGSNGIEPFSTRCKPVILPMNELPI